MERKNSVRSFGILKKKRRNIQIERQERKLDEKSSFAKGSARSVRLTNSGLSFSVWLVWLFTALTLMPKHWNFFN